MKSILITGCSTGFGRAAALHFARRGWRVFATVRKDSDRQGLLDATLPDGTGEKSGDLTPLLCDIVEQAQVKALGRTVAAQTSTLDALVNNAGSAFPAPIELIPPDVLRQQLDLNVIAQVAVTQAVLPLLKAAGGTIVNVSSVGGRMTTPLLGAYSASKFALEALSDAMRLELAPFGVKVVVIEPGSSPTAIWDTSSRRALALLEQRGIEVGAYQKLIDGALAGAAARARAGFAPQLFADTVEKILKTPRPRARYPIPSEIGWLILARRFIPDEWWDGIMRRWLRW